MDNENNMDSPIEETKKYLDLNGLKHYDEQIKKLIKSQIMEWGQLGGEETNG